jgi:hypothetical protein
MHTDTSATPAVKHIILAEAVIQHGDGLAWTPLQLDCHTFWQFIQLSDKNIEINDRQTGLEYFRCLFRIQWAQTNFGRGATEQDSPKNCHNQRITVRPMLVKSNHLHFPLHLICGLVGAILRPVKQGNH